MNKTIQRIVDCMDYTTISASRKEELHILTAYIQEKAIAKDKVLLNFICTHNSRRSQFSQLWAQVASDYFSIPTECYSGGVEVTAFNERAIESLIRFGFRVNQNGARNPLYMVSWNEDNSLQMCSKLYDGTENPSSNFAAVMTCSHADENCPIITGCEQRIPVRYEDPKKYDDTPMENVMYDYRSFQIATEMFYVFSKVNR